MDFMDFTVTVCNYIFVACRKAWIGLIYITTWLIKQLQLRKSSTEREELPTRNSGMGKIKCTANKWVWHVKIKNAWEHLMQQVTISSWKPPEAKTGASSLCMPVMKEELAENEDLVIEHYMERGDISMNRIKDKKKLVWEKRYYYPQKEGAEGARWLTGQNLVQSWKEEDEKERLVSNQMVSNPIKPRQVQSYGCIYYIDTDRMKQNLPPLSVC